MFTRTKDEALETEIAAVLFAMCNTDRSSSEYAAMVDQLTKLYEIKNNSSKSRVSPDTLAIVAGNLAGILTIVLAEKSSVINSAARAFILKAR